MKQVSKTRQRKHTSHTFHLIMSICTGGVWAMCVWFPLWAWHAMGPKKTVKTVTRGPDPVIVGYGPDGRPAITPEQIQWLRDNGAI